MGVNKVKARQETVFRAAKDTLGQIRNPLTLPEWLPELKDKAVIRADSVAGLTVALILIPQSMAYAQLAGLPAYYGLYAALLPTMIAAFFGSSRQLATGPVAMVSLMTAAALEPLATAGSEAFIAYAVLLSLMVGLFQLAPWYVPAWCFAELPVSPGDTGFCQCRSHHHRHIPARQDIRRKCRQG